MHREFTEKTPYMEAGVAAMQALRAALADGDHRRARAFIEDGNEDDWSDMLTTPA